MRALDKQETFAKLGQSALFWSVVAAGLPFLVYLRTLAPTVYGLDSAELTTGAYVLGIVHAPGAPLYLLLGHLFTRLPIGDVGYRMNLMSACAVAITMFFVFRIICDWIEDRVLSLLVTWFLAFSYYVWISALAAELYALQGAFVAGLIWLVMRWREQAKPWKLYGLALGFGLGLGNHVSLLLLLPGFAVLILGDGNWRHLSLRIISFAMLAGLAGVSVYLYLPIRDASNPPLNYARLSQVDLTTLSGFWWMVTGQMFESLFFSVPLTALPEELLRYGHQLWSNFFGVGILAGLFGLYVDFRRHLTVHLGLLMMFGSHLVFYLTYGARDKALMFVPTFIIWSLWVAVGTSALSRWAHSYVDVPLGHVVMSMMALSALVFNFSYADVSQDRSARELGEAIFGELEPEAAYLGTWKEVPILEYLQIVEAQRTDVALFHTFFLQKEEGRELVDRLLNEERPVYMSNTGFLDTMRLQWEFLTACDCFRVTSRDLNAPSRSD
jgi:hypothetical protein